ncbi:hypothetical protein [Chromobacterium haemolyticum]|uniref:hypothetical protein n=1 Tax=Chromobacterium haemolyticum TaxID=394935 RepID=UPI0023DD3BC8|nr:hypothetical protein [Chromobacterium haemolyticum]
MPPRALIEPEIGSKLSAFSHRLPPASNPASAHSAARIAGIGNSGDSMMPPLAAASGNTRAR